MVGWAMNAAHGEPGVPAHRVVNSQGLLTGKQHFGNSKEMENRLKKDGVKVIKDKVVDFEKRLWDPGKELSI
jgi:methylated-DNA-protein-cysteine methyltransferase-like protein